jgi:hypothetical protein
MFSNAAPRRGRDRIEAGWLCGEVALFAFASPFLPRLFPGTGWWLRTPLALTKLEARS